MPASQPASASDDSASIKAARAEAEKLYAKGYDMTEEAKALDKAGKAGDAKKKYGKALKQFESAVERDNAYYQAWNMIGFCSRHSGDLKKAFAAYQKCLSIAPDYEEAHEYLGEAYLQSGDIANAKMQLAWLRARDSEEADELAEAIEKVAPHAASAAAPGSASAPPDSSAPAARDSSRAK
jgi:tetratricopeptide (TPR) repeat protein